MGKTYKIIEIVGTSSESPDDAIRNAVSEASKSLKGLSWFEAKTYYETRLLFFRHRKIP